MKKPLLSLLLWWAIVWLSVCSAQTIVDLQLIDQVNSWSIEQSATSFKFTQAKSCESLEAMLKKYAKERKTYSTWWTDRMMLNSAVKWIAVEDAVEESLSFGSNSAESISSSSTDYSTTNVQKVWVDEPEVLKTDWKYYYYYNSQTDKVSIVQSPLDIDAAKLDPNKAKIIKEIAMPNGLDDVEMFVGNDRLVLMWNYWARTWGNEDLFNWYRTILAIYDVSDVENLKLLKFENLPWTYHDARLIDNQLYVITQQSLNWYYWPKYEVNLMKGLTTVEVTDEWAEVKKIECSNISYVLPDDENLKLNPTFTIVTALNIKDTSKDIETTALLSPSWEIHMTQDSLYLVSNYYSPSRWNCPRGLVCISSYYGWTTQSLIHKFKRNGLTLKYQNTAAVPWSLLNQYSMDEDSQGNFRILTNVRDSQRSTYFYVLDKSLNLAGKLEKIEPGEDFKSSRYIWDKLYLVTFEQIDPLFVIDIADIKNPKIIWKLEIPWYSTYLHPLKVLGTKQYLIWLGYSTADNGYGGVVNSWVKLSLYEIDYSVKDKDNMISVKEIDTLTQWGKSSTSEALTNPRLFVMDKNYNVTLPLTLSEWKTEWQNCSISYDADWKETSRNCYPVTKQTNRFVGLKTFNITPEEWIKETFAKNYYDDVKWKEWYLNYNMRVGYAGDALFMFNPLFVDFIYPNNTNTLLKFK